MTSSSSPEESEGPESETTIDISISNQIAPQQHVALAENLSYDVFAYICSFGLTLQDVSNLLQTCSALNSSLNKNKNVWIYFLLQLHKKREKHISYRKKTYFGQAAACEVNKIRKSLPTTTITTTTTKEEAEDEEEETRENNTRTETNFRGRGGRGGRARGGRGGRAGAGGGDRRRKKAEGPTWQELGLPSVKETMFTTKAFQEWTKQMDKKTATKMRRWHRIDAKEALRKEMNYLFYKKKKAYIRRLLSAIRPKSVLVPNSDTFSVPLLDAAPKPATPASPAVPEAAAAAQRAAKAKLKSISAAKNPAAEGHPFEAKWKRILETLIQLEKRDKHLETQLLSKWHNEENLLTSLLLDYEYLVLRGHEIDPAAAKRRWRRAGTSPYHQPLLDEPDAQRLKLFNTVLNRILGRCPELVYKINITSPGRLSSSFCCALRKAPEDITKLLLPYYKDHVKRRLSESDVHSFDFSKPDVKLMQKGAAAAGEKVDERRAYLNDIASVHLLLLQRRWKPMEYFFHTMDALFGDTIGIMHSLENALLHLRADIAFDIIERHPDSIEMLRKDIIALVIGLNGLKSINKGIHELMDTLSLLLSYGFSLATIVEEPTIIGTSPNLTDRLAIPGLSNLYHAIGRRFAGRVRILYRNTEDERMREMDITGQTGLHVLLAYTSMDGEFIQTLLEEASYEKQNILANTNNKQGHSLMRVVIDNITHISPTRALGLVHTLLKWKCPLNYIEGNTGSLVVSMVKHIAASDRKGSDIAYYTILKNLLESGAPVRFPDGGSALDEALTSFNYNDKALDVINLLVHHGAHGVRQTTKVACDARLMTFALQLVKSYGNFKTPVLPPPRHFKNRNKAHENKKISKQKKRGTLTMDTLSDVISSVYYDY